MATVVICIVLAAIIVYAIVSYRKKLTRGCCGGEADAPEKVRPSDADASHYPYRYALKIEGMTCKNCSRRVESAFNKEGFYALSANFKTGEAEVLSKEEASESSLRSIVARAGYTLKKAEREGA